MSYGGGSGYGFLLLSRQCTGGWGMFDETDIYPGGMEIYMVVGDRIGMLLSCFV